MMSKKIKFIKDTELCKVGDIREASKKSAESAVNAGYAEYVEEPKKKSNGVDLLQLWEDHKASKDEPEQQETPQLHTKVSIVDLFKDQELVEKNDGSFKTECPCCGLQGGRTRGFIIWPETNMAYCHTAMKSFILIEAYALKKGIIKCIDGREKGQKGFILDKEQYKETIDYIKEDFEDDVVSELFEVMGMKEKIELPDNGKLRSEFATELGKKFSDKDDLFFRSDTRQVVEIVRFKNIDGEIEYTGFEVVKANRFITKIENYFKPWEKKERQNGTLKYTTKTTSTSVGSTVLVSDFFIEKLPLINEIFSVPIPIVYKGQVTFPKRGYDERFGSWLPYNAPQITEPEMDLEKAKGIIGFLYKEFPFQSQQDYTHSVSGLLTPLIRRLGRSNNYRPPFKVVKANRARTGKDYHQGITSIVYGGVACEEAPISSDEKRGGSSEELRKKITAAYMAGRDSIHFANNRGKMDNVVLEQFITSPEWSDRFLGTNKMGKWVNTIHGSASGNVGMTMTADLLNRSRTVNLFLDVEDANSRDFNTPDLHGWVKENRGLILSALYSLVRNWFDKDCPDGSVPFTSFPEWARVCGGIMESAGYDSPCMPETEMLGLAVDEETSDMKVLFEDCYKSYPNNYIKKSQIKQIILDSEGDMFVDIDWEKKADQTNFGNTLNKYVGRIMSDIRLSVENPKEKATRRKYLFTKEKATFDKNKIVDSNFDPKVDTYAHVGHLSLPSIFIDTRERETQSGKTCPTCPKVSKTKSDRQIQFWDAEECKDIKPKCEKDKVEAWINSNPNKTTAELYEKFGVGSLKHKNELKAEGKIE